MRKIMPKLAVSLALLLATTVCVASRASAQTTRFNVFGGYSYGTSSANLPDEAPFNLTFPTSLNGYSAAFTFNLNNHLGLEANFTGYNGSPTFASELPTTEDGYRDFDNQSVYVYTFGPRLSQNLGDFTVFTHFLVGGTHANHTLKEACIPGTSDTCGTPNPEVVFSQTGSGFAFKTGGGVDWNHGRWGIRILEVDYVHSQMLSAFTGEEAPISGFATTGNNFELTTGITFNFGHSL